LRACAAGVLLAVGFVSAGLVGKAAAAAPPYEPDPHAVGTLAFFNAEGQQIFSGNINDKPFATWVQASHEGRQGDNKATLFGYLPKSGQDPAAFSGEALTSSQTYPNNTAPGALGTSSLPIVKVSSSDTSLADLASDFPNTATDEYKGLYQLRIKTSGPGQAAGDTYDATSIKIEGTTWTQVYPAPTPPDSSTTTSSTGAPSSSTSTSTTVHPSSTTSSTTPTSTTALASTTTTTAASGATTTTTAANGLVVKNANGTTLAPGTPLAPGSTLSITGGGYAPGETVTAVVRSTPVTLGSATANSAGSVALTVTLPRKLEPGNHTLSLEAASATKTFAFSVVSSLSRTGADVVNYATYGFVLLVAGAAAVAVARRNQERNS
jgi:hypothetical protein